MNVVFNATGDIAQGLGALHQVGGDPTSANAAGGQWPPVFDFNRQSPDALVKPGRAPSERDVVVHAAGLEGRGAGCRAASLRPAGRWSFARAGEAAAGPPSPSPRPSSMVRLELKPCSTTSVEYLSWPDWSCHLRVCSAPSM